MWEKHFWYTLLWLCWNLWKHSSPHLTEILKNKFDKYISATTWFNCIKPVSKPIKRWPRNLFRSPFQSHKKEYIVPHVSCPDRNYFLTNITVCKVHKISPPKCKHSFSVSAKIFRSNVGATVWGQIRIAFIAQK